MTLDVIGAFCGIAALALTLWLVWRQRADMLGWPPDLRAPVPAFKPTPVLVRCRMCNRNHYRSDTWLGPWDVVDMKGQTWQQVCHGACPEPAALVASGAEAWCCECGGPLGCFSERERVWLR